MSLKFCANLSLMFQEGETLLDRYIMAKRAGFKAVQCESPYDFSIEQIVKAKEEASLKQILINTPLYNYRDFGYAALGPEYNDKFLQGIHKAIDYATALDCPMIHILCGKVQYPTVNNRNYLIENLKRITPLLEKANITGVIEVICERQHYYLQSYDAALQIVKEVNSPNIRLVLDIFELIITNREHGIFRLGKLLPYSKHIQIAQVPGRNEPNSDGLLDCKYMLGLIERSSYTGYIGLQYYPNNDTVAGLDWITQFGYTLDN